MIDLYLHNEYEGNEMQKKTENVSSQLPSIQAALRWTLQTHCPLKHSFPPHRTDLHKGRYSARMTVHEISHTLLHNRLLSSQPVRSKTNGEVLIKNKNQYTPFSAIHIKLQTVLRAGLLTAGLYNKLVL
jgi:hypothetical protein